MLADENLEHFKNLPSLPHSNNKGLFMICYKELFAFFNEENVTNTICVIKIDYCTFKFIENQIWKWEQKIFYSSTTLIQLELIYWGNLSKT